MPNIEDKVIIRTENAGCFYGTLKSRDGNEATLTQSRRLWYWSGAASLSELAQRGTSKPGDCKFPIPVDEQDILGVIEVLSTTVEAQATIEAVEPWSV